MFELNLYSSDIEDIYLTYLGGENMGRVRNVHHVRVIASVLLMCIIVSIGLYGILMQSNVNDVAVAAESNYVEPYIDLDDNAASLKGSIEAAHTIKNNLSIFVEEYNKTEEGISNPAMINSVENEAAIYLTFKNEYAYYLDFNDDNGYLIVDDDYSIQEFAVSGDLDYLKEVDYAFYNPLDKFLYYDFDNNIYKPYEEVGYNENALIAGNMYSGADNAHDGQHSDGGEGKIYDLDAYVAQNYSKYSRQAIQIIPNYQWIYQWNTSLYKQNRSDGSSWSEGNCVINATYSMMKDWKDQGYYTNLPSNTVDYRSGITSNAQYNKYGNGSYDGWTTNSSHYLQRMPQLYLELREQAVIHGYLPDEGMLSSKIPEMVRTVGQKYGYNFTIKSSTAHNSIVASMNAHRAGVLSVQNSESYGNHAMGLYGFVVYHYKSGWWIFSKDNYAYFYLIDDGHSYKSGDPNFAAHTSGVIEGMDGLTYYLCYYDANRSNSKTFYYLSNY